LSRYDNTEINVTDKSNGILFLLLPTKQISANV
jgi:hypothetical protein